MSPLREWYFVRFDNSAIALQVNPPNGDAWEATIPWERITRICFKTGDWFESDEIYLFTDERPESYLIPTEAEGGGALWCEILKRKLYHGEVAIDAPATIVEPDALPLESPDQLPDLEGETLLMTWDQIQSDSLILHGDTIIWRERTGWEVYDRFEEIAIILKRKYGSRLVDLLPTPRSLFALYGDSTAASFHVASVRESLIQETRQNTTTSDRRLADIRSLLKTALDCEEGYLYEGAMGNHYMNSYATDAASDLSDLFGASEPTAIEINCCVDALSDPERIKNGRSKKLLLQLRERSRPILKALANAPDPQLRLFALETAKTSLNPLCFMPLYGSIDLEQRLLNDPDESVRIAAIAAVKQTIDHNAAYLQRSLQTGTDNPMTNLFHQFLAMLTDPSATVRAAVATSLGVWVAYVGHEALAGLLEHENALDARAALARAKALYDPTLQNDKRL